MPSKEELIAWPFLKQLSKNVLGFELDLSVKEEGTKTILFTYTLQEKRCQFIAFYDEATRDFMVRIIIGLTEYNDVGYIVTDVEVFEKLIKERMTETLHKLSVYESHHMESILLNTGITTWQYGLDLPQKIRRFELFIRPSEPIKMINGSYIVLDYSCFEEESNLLIYYNIYRDEYFGEIRLRRTPEMTFDFDAKTLKELEENLKNYLESTIIQLESRLLEH